MEITAIMSILGLVLPPVTDFVKKKFLKSESETPEATMSTLATTSPDTLPSYMNAMADWYKSLTGWFNRDVVGTPSQWVVDLRSGIRPAGVVFSFVILGLDQVAGLNIDPATKGTLGMCITSWFSSRFQ